MTTHRLFPLVPLLILGACQVEPYHDVADATPPTPDARACALPLTPTSGVVRIQPSTSPGCGSIPGGSIFPSSDFVVKLDEVDDATCESALVAVRPADRVTWNLYARQVSAGHFEGMVTYQGCEYTFTIDQQ